VMNQSPFGQQNKGPDSKNFLLAMVLSMAIIFGWQFFYGMPGLTPPVAEKVATTKIEGAVVPGTATPGSVIERAAALTANPRVAIETKELAGSINLMGAQLDDLHLKNYHEKANRASPTITFLSPANTEHAYFADQGFVGAPGQIVKVPDSKTVWTAPQGAVLNETTPLVLTWDNGAGVTFRREISISEDFLFTVKQSVDNKTTSPIALLPYARVQRQGTPKVEGYFSFFEGMLGMQNEKLVELHYSDMADDKSKIETPTRGGWLGFTDKYWGTSLIPEQARDIKTTFQYLKQGDRDAYQTDYVATEPVVVAPGAIGTYEDHIYAGAKIVANMDAVAAKHNIANFKYMIDWGWFWFLTQPMFSLMSP
jgi:YidC/Oxa1 family membrane protein insertase